MTTPANILAYLSQPLPELAGRAPVDLYNFIRGGEKQEPAVQQVEIPVASLPIETNEKEPAKNTVAELAVNLTSPQDAVRQAEVQKEVAKPDTSRDEEIARKLAEEELQSVPQQSVQESIRNDSKVSKKEEKAARKELKRLQKEERRASGHHTDRPHKHHRHSVDKR